MLERSCLVTMLFVLGCAGAREGRGPASRAPRDRTRDAISLGRVVAGWSFPDGRGFTLGVDVVLDLGEAAAGRFRLESEAERERLKKEILRRVQASIPRAFRPEDVRKAGFLERLASHILEVLDRGRRRGGPGRRDPRGRARGAPGRCPRWSGRA